ncbi:MAG TPA: hypothetical protein VGR60_01695 [Gemmatimonadales bacterium]|nr:hypothetical protein [Gemmatimonadales bacterium]
MPHTRGRGPRLALALIAACGCSHVDPGAPSDPPITHPFDPAPPVRLTLNPGQDQWPAWTPDGRKVWYAYEDLDRTDHDQCLGLLPAGGGTRTVSACQDAPVAAAESLDVASSPAVHGGQVAWMRATSPIGGVLPEGGDLVVAGAADLSAPRSVRHFPFVASTGRYQSLGTDVQWLDDSTLAYVGIQINYNFISHDTSVGGVEVTLVGLAGASPATSVVGGTVGATSLSVGPTPGELFFTRGDTRIYQLQLPDTVPTIAFDFGALGIAEDVRAAGTRMLAVVADSAGRGGTIYLVDAGVATAVTPPGTYWRHPALRPDGRAFAAERFDTLTATYDIYSDSLP